EGGEGGRFEALTSNRRNRSAGQKGSHAAAVFDPVSEMGQNGKAGGAVQSLLSRWLAFAFGNKDRGQTLGLHHEGRCGSAKVQRAGSERKLCASHFEPDASQSRRMEPHHQSSEIQTASGTRAQVEAG